MKKILQPIMYLLTTIFSVVFIIGAWEVTTVPDGQIFWKTKGVLVALLIFLTSATAGLFIGNNLMNKIYDIEESAIKKHIRQSLIFYVLFIYQISQGFSELKFFSINCRVDCEDFIPLALITLMPLLAIIANAIYVFLKCKKNIT